MLFGLKKEEGTVLIGYFRFGSNVNAKAKLQRAVKYAGHDL